VETNVKSVFAVVLMLAAASPVAAQIPQSSGQQSPAPQAPSGTPPAPPASSAPAPTPAATAGRTFSAPAGLLFNTVRPDRVADFEKVLGYVRSALENSADANDRAKAAGWRVFKAAEPGPSGSVLYVFVIDPTVRGADYAFGPILAEAYPDTAQLQEIWKLYTGAVTSGGTLLNLVPVTPGAAAGTPSSASPDTSPRERPLPPDADPNRR
jgi:hypothetical protein